jgi:uroporphyrinogen decarboxylase
MDRRARVHAALRGEPVDRTPFSLWRHFHREDRTPEGLSAATVALARTYDLDLVKLTPGGLYAVEDWAGDRITYPGTEHDAPALDSPAVTEAAGWRRLPALEPDSGALGRELRAVQQVAAALAGETPFLMTVYSPLTLAYKLAGEAVVDHLRHNSQDLHAGLAVMAKTTACFARAALEAGADGLFFATQLATHRHLAPEEYQTFGTRYDLAVLESVAGRSSISVLHLHGRGVFFDLADRYPVHAVSWHDRETAPSLAQARRQTSKAFITGLDRKLLRQGPEDAIRRQAAEAMAATEGRGLVLAPSCVIPTEAPEGHLQAVRDAVLAR